MGCAIQEALIKELAEQVGQAYTSDNSFRINQSSHRVSFWSPDNICFAARALPGQKAALLLG